MKVSLSWMKVLAGQCPLPLGQPDLEAMIGEQLGAIEETVNLSDVYKDALLVKVISSKRLDGSDHLSVCLIDDKNTFIGLDREGDGLIQVVCGAANVAEGQIVVWLPPGSIVPSTYAKDPFKLESRKFVGQISNGMLASAKELAIGDDHEGIVVLPDGTDYGVKLLDYLELDDRVIDIENKMFTHRPDLFGQLGVAREICGIYGEKFVSPDWYREDINISGQDKINLIVNNSLGEDGCPRFMAIAIDNIKIEPSPLWLQSYLSRVGIRPINNIVDITNYVMMTTGQPLHAYDLKKLAADDKIELNVRRAKHNEQLILLDGSSVTMDDSDIVIASQDQAIGLGGVMGGGNSEVDASTTRIVLECATFDMYSIRRTSMRHGIFSEAVTRFTKGQSPRQCPAVIGFAVDLIKKICLEAEVASNLVDAKSSDFKRINEVSVDVSLVHSYLGMELEDDRIVELLNNTELDARIETGKLYVKPPFWRMDIESSEDLIEEVARLFGFNMLPQSLPVRVVAPPALQPLIAVKRLLRQTLIGGGANELLTYSFVDDKLPKLTGMNTDELYVLSNALSPDLKYYRAALLPSIMQKVHQNHKAGYEQFALFELGKAHITGLEDGDGLPIELERLALVVSSQPKLVKANYLGAPYYQSLSYLYYLFDCLGLDKGLIKLSQLDSEGNSKEWLGAQAVFQPGRSAVIKMDNKILGVVGEFVSSVSKALKLPEYCSGLELDLVLLSAMNNDKTETYHPLSKYPMVSQDITVGVEENETYANIFTKLTHKLADIIPKDITYKIYPIETANL